MSKQSPEKGKCKHEWLQKETKNNLFVPANVENNGVTITGTNLISVYCKKCLEVVYLRN